MIEVEKLTKRYGDMTAINELTFQVKAGEVMGFLGANGAGKTTTLRILACYLPATSGTARIGGLDVFRDSLEVRKKIGYLPESVPLYEELRITEYLKFRAGLKGLRSSNRNTEIERVIDRCQLSDRKRQIIGTLSRGLKQRVGLADALLGSPPLLILDEPTSGLDPLQRMEVRKLISELKEDHTVFLSTHILSEAEAVCSRVLILQSGSLIDETKIQHIRNHRYIEISCIGTREAIISSLKKIDTIQSVKPSTNIIQNNQTMDTSEHTLTLTPTSGKDPRSDIVELFASHRKDNWQLCSLQQRTPSLEEVFTQTAGEA